MILEGVMPDDLDEDSPLSTREMNILMIKEMAKESARQLYGPKEPIKEEGSTVSARKMQRQIADLRARVSDLEKLVANLAGIKEGIEI